MNKKNSHSHHLMSNHTPKTMPQLPYIPLKGYRYHAPTLRMGLATCAPMPRWVGAGAQTRNHTAAPRMCAIVIHRFYFYAENQRRRSKGGHGGRED